MLKVSRNDRNIGILPITMKFEDASLVYLATRSSYKLHSGMLYRDVGPPDQEVKKVNDESDPIRPQVL